MDGTRRLDAGLGRTDLVVGRTDELEQKRDEKKKPPVHEGGGSHPIAHGLVHEKKAPISGSGHVASIIDAHTMAQYARHLKGEVPVDAASYAALTGIHCDAAETARLDALVKSVAKRIGLEHPVGFQTEAKYLGHSYEYAFLGMVEAHNRKGGQPIFIGLGLKAQSFDDVNLLYKFDSRGLGIPRDLKAMITDYLALTEEQRIESILVHEHLELEAAKWGSSSPHRSAVSNAPETDLNISPRVRKHLELYARLDQQLYGGPGR